MSGKYVFINGNSDASSVNYKAPFTGAVTETVQNKLTEIISVKDFGAVGDGATDDTAAIVAAIASLSATGGTVYFPIGIYLVSSRITISTNGVTLRGTNGLGFWNGVSSIYQGGSVILKKSTMTTEVLKNADALNFTVADLAVVGQAGNTGDGIYIPSGQHPVIENVSVARMGGNGIRIGPKATEAYANANGWQMKNVTSMYNGGHGFYFYDEVNPTSPNANGGTASGMICEGNTGNGLHIENAMYNTYTGVWSEQNTGYGVALVGMAATGLYSNLIVSDVEGNTAGNWSIGANLKHVNFVCPAVNFPPVDPNVNFCSAISGGNSLFRAVQFNLSDSSLGTYKEATWTPADASGASLSFTLSSCRYVIVGKLVTCTGRITWPVTASGVGASFTLPYSASFASFAVVSTYGSPIYGYANGTTAQLLTNGEAVITNASMSAKEINVSITYTLP